MPRKFSKYILAGAAVVALGALSFGLTNSAFNISKEFAIVDLGWCEGERNIYECKNSYLYASLANGSTFIGAALGSLLIRFSSKMGRRLSLLLVNIFFCIGCLLSASSVNFFMIFTGRLISGLGIGFSTMMPVFLVEICHPRDRKSFTVIYQLFITFGLVLSAAWQLIHGRVVENFVGSEPFKLTLLDKIIWRGSQALPILSSGVGILIILIYLNFETPYELISKGKTYEARQVIEMLHGSEAVTEVYDEVDRDQEIAKSTPNISFLQAIKNPKYRTPIIHTFVLAAVQQLTGITILTSNVAKMFLKVMGRSFNSTLASSVMFLVNFVTTVILTYYVGRFGRKTFLVFGMSFSTVFLALASLSKPIGGEAPWVPIVSAAGSIGFIIGFAIGLGGVMWVYLSEVYATEYRDAAFSVAVFLNWICASLTLIASEFLISYSEVLVNSFLFGVSIFGLVYVIIFIRETKGVPLGKAYE